jgi:prepilin signal peptidase PulO-like enzyme (type II secretory pathway)
MTPRQHNAPSRWNCGVVFATIAEHSVVLEFPRRVNRRFRNPLPSTSTRVEYLYELILARPLVFACWVFVVGSAIGSFLNVVIYRMPRQMSLSHPASHCPTCGHPIRWYHNLPIAGWLILRGKCHDCRAAISPRYPTVEFVVAVIFVVVAYFDIYLPTLTNEGANTGHVDLRTALLAAAAHIWLACTIVAAALIRWDSQRIPRRLVVVALAVAAAAIPFLDFWRSAALVVLAALLLLIAWVSPRPHP